MSVLTIPAALALSLQCAPSVDPHMIVAIGQHESALDPLTIHDNTTGQVLHGEGAASTARQLIAAGHSVDLGLMQINSMNLGLLGLSVSDAFTACRSIKPPRSCWHCSADTTPEARSAASPTGTPPK